MSANDRQVGGNHYRKDGAHTQQHWDYTWERKFDQFQYVITKYVERWREKGGVQDLKKAQHYLEKYIELVEAEPQPKLVEENPAYRSTETIVFIGIQGHKVVWQCRMCKETFELKPYQNPQSEHLCYGQNGEANGRYVNQG